MDNELIALIGEYIEKMHSMDEITAEFNINEIGVMTAVNKLREWGNNVVVDQKNNTLYFLNLNQRNVDFSKNYTIPLEDPSSFKVLVISDTRLCSKYEQMNYLNSLYKLAASEGIMYVFHCGNISEGIYSPKSTYFDSVFRNDTALQADYIIDNYPFVDGITTLFITGDKDDTHVSCSGTNIGKLIDNKRSDMIYLGSHRAEISIGKTVTMLRSPHEKNKKPPYTLSYRTQQYINAKRSEDKIDVLLQGKYLCSDHIDIHNIRAFQIPSLVGVTPEMDDNTIADTVGAYILEYKFNEKGKLDNIIWTMIPYYVTLKDDYAKAKRLVITKKEDK